MRIGLKYITPMLAAGAAAVAIGAAPIAAAAPAPAQPATIAAAPTVEAAGWHGGGWYGGGRGLDHADRAPPAVVAMANIHQRHSALTWDWRGGPSPDAQGWGATR